MSQNTIKIGKQILDIITSGMYSNSMMVLREYVQNAADSIDAAVSAGISDNKTSRIDVVIDSGTREISIIDNGTGIESSQATSILSSLAISSKGSGSWRGFRGIGRLGGLGYCDQVIFETKSAKEETVSAVSWDAKTMRQECRINNGVNDVFEVISKVITRSKRHTTSNDPDHFFKITMKDVHRFHRDDLMNIEGIHNYLSQVSPVSFSVEFDIFGKKIEKHLSIIEGYRTYNLYLNGEKIFKPHRDSFYISGQSQDKINDIQLFEIKDREGRCFGRGWFAQTAYKASALASERMRGIRIRQGNIEVGDEYFLAELYSERRFATWHIGEIHFDYSVRLNARRDGFEQSSDYECFLEQAILLCKHLSGLCRKASKIRSVETNSRQILIDAERFIELATFASNNTRKEAIKKAAGLLEKSRIGLNGNNGFKIQQKKAEVLLEKLSRLENDSLSLHSMLDGRILRGIDQKQLISDIATRIVNGFNKNSTPVDLVKDIIQPYMRKDLDMQ